MTQLNYPYQLQPGDPEDITQVQANFDAIKGVINGQLDSTNLVASPGLYDPQWRMVRQFNGLLPTASAANTFTINVDGNNVNVWTTDYSPAFYFDPADYTITNKTTQYRLKGAVITNTTVPGTTLDISFRRAIATATAGSVPGPTTSLATTGIGTGATTYGSANTITTFATTATSYGTPTAGVHFIAVQTGATVATGSYTYLIGQLQVRIT